MTGVQTCALPISYRDFEILLYHDGPLSRPLPNLEVEGEMHADSALSEEIRQKIFPSSVLKGRANLFVLPDLDAANIVYNMVRVLTDGVAIGPILMGVSKPAHVLTPSATVRRVVNMTAVASVEAQIRERREAGAS